MPRISARGDARTRVLWLSHVLPWPAKGGLQQRAYYLMRAVGRDCDLRVVTFSQRAHQKDHASIQAGVEALSDFATVLDVVPLPQDICRHGQRILAARSLVPGLPFTVRWGLSAEYRTAVRRAIVDFEPNIVHFDTVSLAEYVNLCTGVPAVLNHHNIESHMLLRRAEQQSSTLRRWYFRQEGERLADFERSVSSRFRRHIVCSELDALRLRETTGVRSIDVIPNGVDLEYFQPSAPHHSIEPHSLVFVGGLSWYPNSDAIRRFLSEVWPLILAKQPHVRLRIIGREPPSDIVAFARQNPRVELLGFVDDIRPTVLGSSVYVCPIRDGGGTKLKMLDAMAMGKAIVAHPVACEGLGVSHGREVLIAEDPGQFCEHVLRALSSPSLRDALGVAARRHVESTFSFDNIGKRLVAILQSEGKPCAQV